MRCSGPKHSTTVLFSAVFVVPQSFLTLDQIVVLNKSIREASREMRILGRLSELAWWVERAHRGGVGDQTSGTGFGSARPWTSLKMFFRTPH